jgi:hypothetical protein
VDRPEVFWNELVLPGWEEGSLTARGYTSVLAECLRLFTENRGTPAPEAVIHAAAHSLAESYFNHSPIENAWKNILLRLAAAPGAFSIIATDHYAETTDHIRGLLAAWNIAARSVSRPAGESGNPFIIANSADLGAHKNTAAFWKTVRSALGDCPQPFVYLIDDFGFNENSGDAYGGREKALCRREKTAACVKEVFGCEPEVFSFFLDEKARAAGGKVLRKTHEILVRRASAFISRRV